MLKTYHLSAVNSLKALVRHLSLSCTSANSWCQRVRQLKLGLEQVYYMDTIEKQQAIWMMKSVYYTATRIHLGFLQTASSLSFSSDLVRAMHARGSGEAARREKRGCLSRLAPSVTRVAIYVSRVLLDGSQKKERLLVVQGFSVLCTLGLVLIQPC